MAQLQAFRVDVAVAYPAAFLYGNTRGVVAERWGHRERPFRTTQHIRHRADPSESCPRRVFACGLKRSSATFIGLKMPGMDEVQEDAGEFLGDCLRVLQPRAVSLLQMSVLALMQRDTFESTLTYSAHRRMSDAVRRVPYRDATFSDLAVTLQHRKTDEVRHDVRPYGTVELAALGWSDEPVSDELPRSFSSCSAG